jgi:predicted membrane protein
MHFFVESSLGKSILDNLFLSILILEIFFKERYLVEIILIIIFHSIHVSKSQRGEKLNLLTCKIEMIEVLNSKESESE